MNVCLLLFETENKAETRLSLDSASTVFLSQSLFQAFVKCKLFYSSS